MKKLGAQIQNWKVENFRDYQVLVGNVYGHSKFFNGQLVITSKIVRLDKKAGMCETQNTIYLLGIEDKNE